MHPKYAFHFKKVPRARNSLPIVPCKRDLSAWNDSDIKVPRVPGNRAMFCTILT